MDELEKQKPVDIDVQRNKLQKELEEKKLGFDAKRKRCKAQMTWPSWYNSAKESTSNLSGINKQSNTINKK
jgi:hypothetical protein